MNAFEICELWIASNPEFLQHGNLRILVPAGATYIFHHFCVYTLRVWTFFFFFFSFIGFIVDFFLKEGLHSLYHNIYFVLIFTLYLCFYVINIGIAYAFRSLILYWAYDLQIDSCPSHLPLLSLLSRHYFITGTFLDPTTSGRYFYKNICFCWFYLLL